MFFLRKRRRWVINKKYIMIFFLSILRESVSPTYLIYIYVKENLLVYVDRCFTHVLHSFFFLFPPVTLLHLVFYFSFSLFSSLRFSSPSLFLCPISFFLFYFSPFLCLPLLFPLPLHFLFLSLFFNDSRALLMTTMSRRTVFITYRCQRLA